MQSLKRERLDTDYRYVAGLSAESIAWEFLRRNPEYRADYHARMVKEESALSVSEAAKVGQKWGLRFRTGPGSISA